MQKPLNFIYRDRENQCIGTITCRESYGLPVEEIIRPRTGIKHLSMTESNPRHEGIEDIKGDDVYPKKTGHNNWAGM